MELRRGRLGDVDGLMALAETGGTPPTGVPPSRGAWAEFLAGSNGQPDSQPVGGVDVPVVIACQDDDRAVIEGVVVVGADAGPGSDDRRAGSVRWLFVDASHRRQGHGRRLLVAAERILAAAGCDTVWLRAASRDESDQLGAFLTSMGWQADESAADPASPLAWQRDLHGPDDAHVTANRLSWNADAGNWVEAGRRAYAPERRRNPNWGCWGIPETEVGMLADVAGADVIELGCGTGYVSAWCLEAGAASVVGLDNSQNQLATARMLQAEHDLHFPLVWSNAERAPFPDASFDFAISEYGAAIWCDPYRWIPEAARLLRPDGRLAFLGNSVAAMLCVNDFEVDDGPPTEVMQRPQRDMHRFAWYDNLGVEFHISHGDMIRLLRSSGFEILDLVELYIEPDAETSFIAIDGNFGSRWPVEEVWLARKRG